MRSNSSRVGFTLVELLVVIGIIAVLISILLPALNKARRQALLVSELSNMRQVGLAVAMYANDNKGRLPGGTGNSGCYPHTHDVVRARLCGFFKDPATGQYARGGPVYLGQFIWISAWDPGAPSSRVWGCPMTADASEGHRYGTSWWWNAGAMDTCDASGKPITCTPNSAGNWWQQSNLADFYHLTIAGGGYADERGRQPNPDNIVLITDAGCPVTDWVPGSGHLRTHPTYSGDVEGACTLFLSGRAMWRDRSQLQYKYVGGPSGWR